MVNKFAYNRLTPARFNALLARSGLSLTEFLRMTGRRRDTMEQWLAGDSNGFAPTMGDALILELAALDEANVDDMNEIVDQYVIEIPAEGEAA